MTTPAPTPSFADLIARVRAGDADAAAEVVRRYEPEIRRAVRLRLTDPGMRRLLDSVDVCQSVLANFFVRAAAGQFDLDDPAQLLKLLVTMARNKLRDQVSFHRAARRDQRRQEKADTPLDAVQAAGPSPSAAAATRDLLDQVRRRLPPHERHLADLRSQGHDWNSIAELVGERADTLRKRLGAALDRVAGELGLDEAHDV